MNGWRRGFVVALASAGLLVAACSTSVEEESAAPPGSASPPPSQGEAATLIEQALAAQSSNRLREFADLLYAAGDVCPDPRSADRLGALAVIADRWESAVEEGRPKVQGRTEAQLTSVDWDALAAACATT